jgi:peptidoglycan/xylan/chitin deacetylase (PgdA/CDA1 family)
LQFAVDAGMRRIALVLALFLVTSIAGAIMAASPSSTVKAEVPHGVISIAFDDNYQDQFDYAFPLMQARGINGTFYAVKNQLRDFSFDSSYMSIAELQTLQDNGNEIGSHSVTHTTFTYLSDNQIRQECNESKQILEANGLAVTNFAYPNGETNDHIDSIVDDYYRSGRTAYVAPYLMDVPTSQFRLAGFSEEPGSLATLKNMVDQVYSTNSWAIIFFHHIQPDAYGVDYTTSTQYFEGFLDYVISKGVQTLTVNQVLDLTPLSMETNFGTVTPTSGFYNLGETLAIEAFAPSAGNGERYVWLGWNGTGSGSYSGTANPAMVTLNGPVNQTALWRHEFKLSIIADNGLTSPSAGEYWYEAGSNVTVEAFAPSAGNGERYVWLGWNGTGSGSYSGLNLLASIVMNGSITQVTSLTHQYEISVVLSGVGSDLSENKVTLDGSTYASGQSFWMNSGSSHSFAFPSELEVNSGKRYIWVSSSGLSTQKSGTIIVAASGALTANYETQFFVNVSSPYGVVSGAGWYNLGSTMYATLGQSVISESSGIRQLFTDWSEDASGIDLTSDSIVVDGPKYAIASWKKQFLVTFDKTGIPNDYDASVLIDSTNHSLPFSIWVDEGAGVEFVYPNHLPNGFGSQYLLMYPSNQSLAEIDSPVTVTAQYDLQYNAEPFIVIITFSVTISLIGIVFLRKKRNLSTRTIV